LSVPQYKTQFLNTPYSAASKTKKYMPEKIRAAEADKRRMIDAIVLYHLLFVFTCINQKNYVTLILLPPNQRLSVSDCNY